MAVFDDTTQDKLVTYPHKVKWKNRVPTAVKAEAQVVGIETTEPLKAECRHFLESVEVRAAPLTDGQEGLAQVEAYPGDGDDDPREHIVFGQAHHGARLGLTQQRNQAGCNG